MTPRNIFIHYPVRDASEVEREEGFQENAFPEVILGNFESGALEGLGQVSRRGHLQQVEENVAWHDTYAVFSVVKKLCLCHVSYPDYDEIFAPENVPCEEINTYLKEEDTRYSQELFNLLQRWEYPNCAESDIGMTQKNDKGEEIPNNSLIPGLEYLVETVLPVARSKVRKYRRPGGDRPGNWYRQLDLSWTKPDRLMPYQWWPEEEIRPANPTGNDDENDDDLDEHGQGNDSVKQDQRSSVKDKVTQGGDQDDDEELNPDLSDIINSSSLNLNPPDGDNNPDDQDEYNSEINSADLENMDGQDDDDGDPGDGDQEKGEKPETSGSSDTETSSSSDTETSSSSDTETSDSSDTEHSQTSGLSFRSRYISNERSKLNTLKYFEDRYSDLRPPHRIIMLSYGSTNMYDIRAPPDRSWPPPPDTPSPTPPGSDNDEGYDSGESSHGWGGPGGGGSGDYTEGRRREGERGGRAGGGVGRGRGGRGGRAGSKLPLQAVSALNRVSTLAKEDLPGPVRASKRRRVGPN
ncbi:hypothetical protein ANO14919_010450 [Xylariales sp. No.14919]|nr:hypothetical protein ANO14919_010450 [Xylariales sp. No.14919]